MALNTDLNTRMTYWQNEVLRELPNRNDVKRCWAEQRYLMVPYLAGIKKGMEDCYEAIRHVWIEGVAKVPGHIVGDGGKSDGVWFFNVLQKGVWDHKSGIPKSMRVTSEYWNDGKFWEGAYLAGIRMGWFKVWQKLFSVAGQGISWIENQGFPG